MNDDKPSNLYAESGVDIKKADSLVSWLRQDQSKTVTDHGSMISGVGGFAALFKPDFGTLDEPLLVTSTDGVGTKVMLSSEHSMVDGLGQDLVAMCVNDLYTMGAKPLFFLDYFSTSKLDENQFKSIVKGIKSSVEACGAVLIGGETAEMPGLYDDNHFDLAGFVVGCVDETKLLGPHRVKPNDSLYALNSSGFHSNGYSLIRKWVEERPINQEILEKLLKPTKLYHEVPKLVEQLGVSKIHSIANITGGGISNNLPRVMPKGSESVIDTKRLPVESWMREFINRNNADIMDVETTFNLGCGMIVCISEDAETDFETTCSKMDLKNTKIGTVLVNNNDDTPFVRYK